MNGLQVEGWLSMIKIQIKKEPVPKGKLMSNRELKKILGMINAKVKAGIVITYQDIEEQFLRTGKMCYKLCQSLTDNETTPIYFYWID